MSPTTIAARLTTVAVSKEGFEAICPVTVETTVEVDAAPPTVDVAVTVEAGAVTVAVMVV
jgi:hypothetical protein